MSRPGLTARARPLRAFTLLAALALALTTHGPAVAADVSQPSLGVELPTLGITFNHSWRWTFENYFSPAVADDIVNNLHASFVRTGWIPNWYGPRHPWRHENQILDSLCGAGLHLTIIVPGLDTDRRGEDDLLQNVRLFFAHFTAREPGCLQYAEIANEGNLSANGFPHAADYARYYAEVAPIVSSFGIPVITTGVSGEDTSWIRQMASDLRSGNPPPPSAGYGFHPYGVPVEKLPAAMDAMRAAAGPLPDGSAGSIYITEIGRSDPNQLFETIVKLAPLTPMLTVYEYKAQAGEPDEYGLVDHPKLYDAVRRAFDYVRSRSVR